MQLHLGREEYCHKQAIVLIDKIKGIDVGVKDLSSYSNGMD